jgi:hypothetical protein
LLRARSGGISLAFYRVNDAEQRKMKKTFHQYVLSPDFQYFLLSAGTGEAMSGLMLLAAALLRQIKRHPLSA